MLLGSAVSELGWERAKLFPCFGGLGIRVAEMGVAAQATYKSTVDLHKAVMSNICVALRRPLREPYPEEASALAAKADLPAMGVAVDEYARVKRAAEIVRRALVQSADIVLSKSVARDMAFAKLQSRILAAAEAVQAAKLHSEMPSEQQAIMLSAGGPGTGTCWMAMHKSAMEDGHGDSVQRQMQARAPRVLCGKATMGTCAPFPFAASTEEPRPDRTMQSSTPCACSSRRQEAMRTWSATSLSSTTGCYFRRGFLVPGCPAKVRRNQEWLQWLEKQRRRSVMEWPCERWSSRLVEDSAAKAPSCCVIWWQRRRTDSAARILSDDGGPSWDECW